MTAEMLSAYLEDPDDLSPDERELIEYELSENPETQRMFRELDALTVELRNLPQMQSPRSYRVTPAMLGVEEPTRIGQHEVWYMRHMDKIRWAAAAAAILFVVVVTADLLVNGLGPGGSLDDDGADGPVSMSSDDRDDSARTDDDDAAAEMAPEDESEAMEEDAEESDEPDTPVSGDDDAADTDESDESADVPEEAADEEDDGAGISGVEGEDTTPTEEPVKEEGEQEEEGEQAEETPDAQILGSPVPDEEDDAALEEGTPSQGELESAQAESDAETTTRESDSDRTLWRAAEFSLIVIVAVLLALIIFLPRRAGPNR
ncbi:MAG: hypothetical protein ACOC9Y_05095 [Chloroflexota bacterium]